MSLDEIIKKIEKAKSEGKKLIHGIWSVCV